MDLFKIPLPPPTTPQSCSYVAGLQLFYPRTAVIPLNIPSSMGSNFCIQLLSNPMKAFTLAILAEHL